MENTYVSGKQKFNDRVGEIIILKGDDHESIKNQSHGARVGRPVLTVRTRAVYLIGLRIPASAGEQNISSRGNNRP